MSTRCYKSSRCKAIKGLDQGYGCQLKGPTKTAMPDYLTNKEGTRCNPGFRVCPDRRCYPSEWFAEGKDADEVDRYKNMSAKDTLTFLKGRYTTTYKKKAKKLPFSGQAKYKMSKGELGSIVHGFGAQKDPAAMAAFARRSAAAKKAAATRKAKKASKKSPSPGTKAAAEAEAKAAAEEAARAAAAAKAARRETLKKKFQTGINATKFLRAAAAESKKKADEAAAAAEEAKTKVAEAAAARAAESARRAAEDLAAARAGTGSPGRGSPGTGSPKVQLDWVGDKAELHQNGKDSELFENGYKKANTVAEYVRAGREGGKTDSQIKLSIAYHVNNSKFLPKKTINQVKQYIESHPSKSDGKTSFNDVPDFKG